MPESTAIVVGGGASGLSAAAALTRRGIAAVVLEQDDVLGGTWARRYERLHLHTMRQFSGLAHYPIPRGYPTYLSRDEVVGYLTDYARQCGLRIVMGTQVRKIRSSSGPGADWIVATERGEWRSAIVVIATGQYREPILPAWPGRSGYGGRLSHSIDYRNAKPYVGQRVLVVGSGNSGAEIATDLADNGAAYVALSIRTPPTIVPRDPFGMPVQRTSIFLSALPASLANRFGMLTARLTIGDLTGYGVPRANFIAYTTKQVPLIDVGFVAALKQGRVVARPALARLTAAGAIFADQSEEPFDSIVAATGFTTGLRSIVDASEVLDARDEPLTRAGDPTSRPGLYFVGFTHSLRGHLFEANRASRRLARNVARYLASGAGTSGRR